MIAAFSMWLGKSDKKDNIVIGMELTTAVLLGMDAIAWGMRGYEGLVGAIGVRVSNFAVFVLTYTLSIRYTVYVVELLKNKADFPIYTWLWAKYMINLLGIAMIILNLFGESFYYFDAQNYYHRGESYILIMVVGLGGTVIDVMFMIFDYRSFDRRTFWMLMSYLILPMLAGVFQTFHYGIGVLNMSIAVAMLLIFLDWQIEKNKKHMMLHSELVEKEKKLTDMRQDVMLSQIQPHFLYNSLTAIAQLCEKNPKQAKKATIAFADYLRGNMDALNEKKPIPFEKELVHIENYMKLEQIRFGEELEAIYDIETVDFKVPVLSVQPIVENAVKHGIKRHGTVVLHTQEDDDGFQIWVEDDGVGFDLEKVKAQQKNSERSHIGIANVEKRLKEMSNATLTYFSRPGEGTKVIIKIPKDENSENS